MKTKKFISAFHYFGGKSPFLKFLYNHFPLNVHFIDCMCGSGSVALNARQYQLVTVNDLNDEVINFFEVLRNHYAEFLHQVKFTPFSRQEFYNASLPTHDKIEKARRFFVRAMQGFAGMGSQNAEKGWGYEIAAVNKYNNAIRNHFRVDTWNTKLLQLEIIVERLRSFQIENLPVVDIVEKYGKAGVLLYIDPPYVRSLRADKKRYRFEFTDLQHQELAEKINNTEAFVAVSGYEGDLYDKLFPAGKWFKVSNKPTKTNTKKVDRIECLWTNYNPLLIKPNQLF